MQGRHPASARIFICFGLASMGYIYAAFFFVEWIWDFYNLPLRCRVLLSIQSIVILLIGFEIHL